jgi:hypothetical protein
VRDPYAAARRDLEDTTLRGPGKTSVSLRERIADERDVPADLRQLVDKIAARAYQVTDDDLAVLKERYSEDELFEIIVAAAIGAARRRLEAGLNALEQA